MSKKGFRVEIPINSDQLCELAEAILSTHTADPAASPLSIMDIAAFSARTTAARAKVNQVKQLRRDTETATQDRDDLLGRKPDQRITTPGTVLNFVARSRDILLGHFKGNEQRLGDFGFTVNRSRPGSGDSGPPADPAPPAATGAVNGQVAHMGTLMPLEGARAEVLGTALHAVTDAAGSFAISGVAIGPRTVRITKEGFSPFEAVVSVSDHTPTHVSAHLSPLP